MRECPGFRNCQKKQEFEETWICRGWGWGNTIVCSYFELLLFILSAVAIHTLISCYSYFEKWWQEQLLILLLSGQMVCLPPVKSSKWSRLAGSRFLRIFSCKFVSPQVETYGDYSKCPKCEKNIKSTFIIRHIKVGINIHVHLNQYSCSLFTYIAYYQLTFTFHIC